MTIGTKTYKELCKLTTFEDRYKYLQLYGRVGKATFAFERYLNQIFYRSKEWKHVRREAILRDDGCDLAMKDREIFGKIIVHHLNPITIEDIENGNDCLFDLNNLICTSLNTSNAIHYGDSSLLVTLPVERRKGDTCPWIVS